MGVDTSILNNIKSKVTGPQLTTDDYSLGLTPDQEAEMAQYSKAEKPVTGGLALTDYYPDVNNPVGVGSYSGSMIGSTTLFAPGGGLVPLGMMDARDKAIQDAAFAKVKEYDAFRKLYQAPTTKLVNIQPEISKEYNTMLQGYMAEAKKKYGKNWTKALEQDSNFQSKNKAFQDLAKYGDSIVEAKARLDEAKKTGKYTVTPALIETEKKLLSATDPDSPEFKKLGDYYRAFNMDLDFNDVYNEAVKEVAMQQDAQAGINVNDPEYLSTFKSTDKYYSEQAKEAVIQRVSAQFPGSDYFTPEYIRENVTKAMSAHQKTADKDVKQKREPSDGADFKYEDNDMANEAELMNVEYQTKEGQGGLQDEQVVGQFGVTFKKPVKTILTPGTQVFYPNDPTAKKNESGKSGMISKTTPQGATDVVLGKSTVMEVIDNPGQWDDGRPVTAQWKKRNPNGKTKHDVFVTGYEVIGKGEKEKKVPFFVPANAVENVLVKKRDSQGNITIGVPLDKQRQKASQLDEEGSSFDLDVVNVGGKKEAKGGVQKTQAVVKPKTSKGSTYTIKGKKYSLKELTDMGYTESQVSQYKD